MRNKLIKFAVFSILFFCLCFFRVYANEELSFPGSLGKTISMDFQDATLQNILKVFSMQSGLNFITSEAVQERKMSLYLDKVPIKEAMDKIFKANNLTYELEEEANIFIVKDWGKPELQTITKVYRLKYRSVPSANLEKEKSALLASGQAASGTSTAASAYGSTGTASTTTALSSETTTTGSTAGSGTTTKMDIVNSIKQVLSEKGKVAEDVNTNSLIVTDVPSSFPEVERIIECLDVPQPQIMLDVEILDVSKNVVDKLGFEFSETPFSLIMPGAVKNTDFLIGSVTNRKAGAITSASAGAVVLGNVYAQTLNYLRTQTDTKYLARPRLLTLNNETAEIAITKDEVVGRRETTTVPTTGGQTTTVEYIRSTDLALTQEGTGIYLRVTPQINHQTNEITMVINPKSSVTATSTLASTQADAEVRSTKSIVKVKDGETVILGGLIHKDKSVVSKKLPILGDIPLLGALFRSKNQTKDIDRELIIFITPHIIKESGIELAQTKKALLSEREQSVVTSRADRQAVINDYLDNFDIDDK